MFNSKLIRLYVPFLQFGLLMAFALNVSIGQNTLFSLVPADSTGIKFNNLLSETEQSNVLIYQYLYNGGGVAAGDINNDGLVDLFFTGNMVQDKLYINKGNFKFEDITIAAGLLAPTGWSTGVTMADVNGDGWLDIYVCKSGQFSTANRHNLLYINNGNNTFLEQAKTYGLNDSSFSTQAAFFDMDLDGDLDMFLLNHAVAQPRSIQLGNLRNERDQYAGNKLFSNNNGLYTDVSTQAGIKGNLINFGLGLIIGDINNDGYPDIFVTNDYNEQDFFYLNNKKGGFTEILTKAMAHISNFSMGCDMADINNDGYLDLFVVDMLPEDNYRQKLLKGPSRYDAYELSVENGYYHQIMHNMLQINNGNNTFAEIAYSAGIAATDWSWAPLFADFDNDGYQDVYITNGYRRDFTNMDFLKYTYGNAEKVASEKGEKINTAEVVKQMPEVKISNYLFKGNAALQFENISASAAINIPSFSNGAAYADFDNDGDIDIAVNNINDNAFVFRNNATAINNNNFLRIKCIGELKNTNAIGTRIKIITDSTTLTRELMPTRGFQSSVDPVIHFGLGNSTTVNIEIIFPSGKRLFYENHPVNTTIVAEEKTGQQLTAAKINTGKLFFDVTTTLLNYAHAESNYIDYKREPLLPYKLSEQGPKFASGDLNGDGNEDIFICGAKNKKAHAFISNNNGVFTAFSGIWETDSAFEDTDALIFDADNDGDNDIYVVSGSNEYEDGSAFYQDRLYINNGINFVKSHVALPKLNFSKSCIKANDIDADGDLDLFVGGKLIPGKYPLSPQSTLLINNKGIFTDATVTICPELLTIGSVNDAQFADINNDGNYDLIIVGDWMPIKIFINNKSSFTEIASNAGLINTSGWWNCIKATDIDGDGDVDFIGGNRGTNHPIKASVAQPAKIYPYDFDNNGYLDPIITHYFNNGKSYPAVSRDDLLNQIPSLKKQFIYYETYANATINQVFPEINFDTIPVLSAQQFESAIFRNNGDNTFTTEILPAQAQWFPINSIVVHDYNADDLLDIVVAGNNYDIRPESGRIDAGRGLLLTANSNHSFTPNAALTSGLYLPGEIKHMEIIYLSGDNYLFVSKNRGSMQVLMLGN